MPITPFHQMCRAVHHQSRGHWSASWTWPIQRSSVPVPFARSHPREHLAEGAPIPGGCDSVNISTKGVGTYQTVCGKLAAYQIGSTDAFERCGSNPAGTLNPLLPNTIDDPYVDGVSITYYTEHGGVGNTCSRTPQAVWRPR